MLKTQPSFDDLLNAVENLETPELERFTALVLSLRARRVAPNLPLQETELLEKINQGLPAALWSRYHELIAKRRAETIASNEQAELLSLTDEVETLHAQRIEQLAELARLRGISLAALMEQLGVQAPTNA